MRLLTEDDDHKVILRTFDRGNVPDYAILSHTWRTDNSQEVSFQDLGSGTIENKAGYDKIRFCQKQAAADGLRYFWVDTCCINKHDVNELNTAINSMFRWYRQATKCYVYLADVHVPDELVDAQAFPITWGHAFRTSRWFSRGWTLQELLAPATVEFFSANGKKLGNKISLEQGIYEATRIPIRALTKYSLEEFSIDDRISWATKRMTTVEEDRIYCLLGIFDVSLPLIYGEGEHHASKRLMKEIEAQTEQSQKNPFVRHEGYERIIEENHTACLRSLGFLTLDARQNDIASAHPDTCEWLFETTEFRKWRDQTDLADHNGVLWLKGKPGAGKSTLMKHALNYCKEEFGDQLMLAYFFNARGERLEKTALGLLRSIVYQLMQGDNAIRDRFILRFHEKQTMYEAGELEWRTSDLREFIISEIKQRHSKPTLLFVDALDECGNADVGDVVDMLEMLSIKATRSKSTLRICLSSRHYPLIDIKKKLELIVESSEKHRQDIVKYVSDKLDIENEEAGHVIERKADGVFLWAVLVVAMLNKATRAGRVEETQKMLDDLPCDLEKVFDAMLAKDETHKAETVLMLQWVLFSPNPLNPKELFWAVMTKAAPQLIQQRHHTRPTDKIIQRRITDSSKGLIEVRPGARSTVQFIHQSVNDFLLRNQRLQKLDPTLKPDPGCASHQRLWSCCREYIRLMDMTWISRKPIAEVRDTYPFMEYAMASVFNFANKALPDDRTRFHDLPHFPAQKFEVWQWLQECNGNWFEVWKKFIQSVDDLYLRNHGLFVSKDPALLYTLCANRYQRLSMSLLSGPGANVNIQGGYHGNALQAASYTGQQEIVKILMEKGADVNAQGGACYNALQAALYKGQQEIVKMLLEKGADVNARGGMFGSALQAANSQRHQTIVSILLQHGAVIERYVSDHNHASSM
ncbi:MAG: hypothetical protein Q9157_006683 [Trypethelium eluteriae]